MTPRKPRPNERHEQYPGDVFTRENLPPRHGDRLSPRGMRRLALAAISIAVVFMILSAGLAWLVDQVVDVIIAWVTP